MSLWSVDTAVCFEFEKGLFFGSCDVVVAMLEDALRKYFSLASFVISSNMAAMSLSLHSLGNDCNARI
jgi:hypothetical protein